MSCGNAALISWRSNRLDPPLSIYYIRRRTRHFRPFRAQYMYVLPPICGRGRVTCKRLSRLLRFRADLTASVENGSEYMSDYTISHLITYYYYYYTTQIYT